MDLNIEVGKINRLRINRVEPQGFYLGAKDEQEILLPNAYKNIKTDIGDEIDVFVYHDSEDRLTATTLMPYAKLNEFGYLEVVDVASFGAFLNNGLPKHLFVPKKYQKSHFKVGDKKIVKVVKDLQTDRLMGVEKFGKFLSYKRPFYKQNDEVKLFVVAKTPLGFKVIVENSHEAMLYDNEIFESIKIGDEKIGYIKQIRKDLKIDVSLQKIGSNDDTNEQKVLEVLRKNDYKMPQNYKSSPEEVKNIFGLSKKAYKKTLTSLIEKKAIEVDENGIRFLR